MTTANKQQITDGACTILTDALELGCGYWAIRQNYKWGSDAGEYELGKSQRYCSADIYSEDECKLITSEDPRYGDKDLGFSGFNGWYVMTKKHHINEKMVADFIVKVGTGEFSQEHVAVYGQLGSTAIKCLRGIYFNDDDPFGDNYDCLTADTILQFILFGEVVYG